MTVNQIHRVVYPTAPVTKKLRGTLLDTATMDPAFPGLDGVGLFESWSTMQFAGVPANCGPSAKTFDQASGWIDGVKFGAYGGVICKHTSSEEMDEQHEQSAAAFLKGESTAVERGLMALRFPENEDEVSDPGGMPGEWAAPTDIATEAGATGPVTSSKLAVALAEEWIASAYNGIGTIHLPRSVASLLSLAKAIEFQGDTLYTPLGTKVAAGAGYAYPNLDPEGAEAADGVRWIYVTGEVVLMRSEVQHKSALRKESNEFITLVERQYVAAIDGNVVGAIAVDIEG